MKVVIEPSAAVPLAAILEGKLDAKGQRIAIILSGRKRRPRRAPVDARQVVTLPTRTPSAALGPS